MNNEMQPNMGNHPCFSPEMMRSASGLMYPDVYYKIQPHILMACDEMDMYGCFAPTQQMMGCMRDRVCDNLIRSYPEMARYAMDEPANGAPNSPQVSQWGGGRGLLGDFVGFLLLSELFRRRRWY